MCLFPKYIMTPKTPTFGNECRAKKIRDCFRAWDSDGSGFISKMELKRVIERLVGQSYTMSQDDIDQLMSEADRNGNGIIEYDEFVDWLTRPGAAVHHTTRGVEYFDLAAVLRPLFEVYDKNGDGTISPSEFEECHVILQNALRLAPAKGNSVPMNSGVMEQEASETFNRIDSDFNQKISFDEFIDWQRKALENSGLLNDDLKDLVPALTRQLKRVHKISSADEQGVLNDHASDEQVLKRIIENLASFTRDLWNDHKAAHSSIHGKHHYTNRWTEPPVGLNIQRLKQKHIMTTEGACPGITIDMSKLAVFCVPEVEIPELGHRRWFAKIYSKNVPFDGKDTDNCAMYLYWNLNWTVQPDIDAEFAHAVDMLPPEIRVFCLLKSEANFGVQISWEGIQAALRFAVSLGYLTVEQHQQYSAHMDEFLLGLLHKVDSSAKFTDKQQEAKLRKLRSTLVVSPRSVMATLLELGIFRLSSTLADLLPAVRHSVS